eukprot:1846073-Pyramimonas_sp.AAC.1
MEIAMRKSVSLPPRGDDPIFNKREPVWCNRCGAKRRKTTQINASQRKGMRSNAKQCQAV